MANAKQSQVIDVRASKGFTSGGESNEILRIASDGAYKAVKSNAFDPTREHLNFEVKNGKVVPVDKENSIGKRECDSLNERGVKDPNAGLEKPRYRTVANFILGGSRERMREMAFGNQTVDFDKGADNSAVTRNKEIEDWAVDVYNFFAEKYGEKNIVAFVCHLDETNPHVHCKLLPVSSANKLSYRKVMIGDENTKEAYRNSMLKLHNELAMAVGAKYGLERGEHISETKAKHRTTEQYHEYRRQELERKNYFLQEDNTRLSEDNGKLKEMNKTLRQNIHQNEIKLKSLHTMIVNLENDIKDKRTEIDDLKQQYESGAVDALKFEMQMLELQKDLEYLTAKKQDKEDKYQEAKLKLEELQQKIEDTRKQQDVVTSRLDNLKAQLDKKLPEAGRNVMNDMQSVGYGAVTNRIVNFLDAYGSALECSSPEERKFCEDHISPLLEETLMDFGENAGNIAQIATNLFLGYIDQATTISASCGGGGSPGEGWGKKKDEDDWRFMQRCFLMGMKMAKPQKKKQAGVSYGLRK